MGMRSASLDLPVVKFGNPADARPAISFHGGKILEAFQIHGNIGSLLLCSLLTNWEGFVDIVNAAHFEIMRAIGSFELVDVSKIGSGQSKEGEQQDNKLHNFFVD